MFVCVCKGVTENQIRDAVGDGCTSLPQLSAQLGVAACCGTCREFAEMVLEETMQGCRAGAFSQAA